MEEQKIKTQKYKDGNIYREDNGYRWQKYLGKDDKGKNKYKKFRAQTMHELKDKVNRYIDECELKGGNVIYGSTVLFGEFAEHWLNDIEAYNLKPTSLKTKRETYKYLIKNTFEKKRITNINHADVQMFINNLANKGIAKSSLHKALQFLNGCIRQFIIQYDISFRNPCENVKIPNIAKSKNTKELKFYNEEQVKSICIEATRKHTNGSYCYRLGWAIVLLIYTGMRRGELLALTWDDIDFDKGIINIDKSTVWIGNKAIDQYSTKTDKSTRKIPLSQKSREALEKLKAIVGDSKYIMETKIGTRVNPRNFDRMFRNICDATNVEQNGVHSLRHTLAKMLLNQKCEVQFVSELLGHSSTTITRDVYIHILNEQKEETIRTLDKYVF